MAEALGAAGARVAILGRSAERGMHRAEQIRRDGGEAVFHSADALDRTSLYQSARPYRKITWTSRHLGQCSRRESTRSDAATRR